MPASIVQSLCNSESCPAARLRLKLRFPRPLACLIVLVAGVANVGESQNSISAPSRPKITLLSPEANNPPDANEQMLMRQNQWKKEDFEAINALRKKEIGEDSSKLLILAADLNEKLAKLGKNPVPKRLMREAEVIELLAHDVQAKMILSVGGN